MIDLIPHHLETVKRILAEHLPDCEVRAFGSRATWTAWEYSDLDLAVVSPEPLDRRTSANLREAFEESDLPIRVGVVDWTSLTDGFRQAIEEDCVVLQQAATPSRWRETTLGDVIELRSSWANHHQVALSPETADSLCSMARQCLWRLLVRTSVTSSQQKPGRSSAVPEW